MGNFSGVFKFPIFASYYKTTLSLILFPGPSWRLSAILYNLRSRFQIFSAAPGSTVGCLGIYMSVSYHLCSHFYEFCIQRQAVILGGTNPFFLKAFENYPHIISLADPTDASAPSASSTSASLPKSRNTSPRNRPNSQALAPTPFSTLANALFTSRSDSIHVKVRKEGDCADVDSIRQGVLGVFDYFVVLNAFLFCDL